MGGSSLWPFTGDLDRYLSASTRRERRAIERDLLARHEETRSVMVTDMSGFSKTVAERGIVHYLALIRRCHRLVLPAFRRARGRVMRTEADNTYTLFDTPADAVAAARAGQARVRRHNDRCPESDRIGIAMGIGHGRLLLRGATDAFGHEFNLASKLGEDVGVGGQVLLTPSARRESGLADSEVLARWTRVAGLTLDYFELRL
jgi:adenylate cyclase